MRTNLLKKGSNIGLMIVIMLMTSGFIYAQSENGIFSPYYQNKKIDKSFSVNKESKLYVDNIFGNINVEYWNENEVSISVNVKIIDSDQETAKKLLDATVVDINNSGKNIKAKTTIGTVTRSNKNGNNINSINVSYDIKMPTYMTCNFKNQFGDINMPEKNVGNYDIDIQFGNIKAGDFSGELNLKSQYGKKNSLGLLENADIEISFGEMALDINNAGFEKISISPSFSKVRIQADKKASFNIYTKKNNSSKFSVKGFDNVINESLSDNEYDSKKDNTFNGSINGGKNGNIILKGAEFSSFSLTAKD